MNQAWNVDDGLRKRVTICFSLTIGEIIRSSISNTTITIPNITAAIVLIKPTANTNGSLINIFSSFS
jgi:hypothetical protein